MEVEFPTGDKTAAQSNGPSEKIACNAPEDEKDSTESRNFFCPSRTAANIVRISGAGVAANLAEIVIAGKAWGKSDLIFLSSVIMIAYSFSESLLQINN